DQLGWRGVHGPAEDLDDALAAPELARLRPRAGARAVDDQRQRVVVHPQLPKPEATPIVKPVVAASEAVLIAPKASAASDPLLITTHARSQRRPADPAHDSPLYSVLGVCGRR